MKPNSLITQLSSPKLKAHSLKSILAKLSLALGGFQSWRRQWLSIGLFAFAAFPSLVYGAKDADPKILIIGSSSDSPRSGSTSDPFPATAIRDELNSILSGAGLGTVNVTLLNRASESTYSLAQWFHNPSPANVETTTRWPNLRGEGGTAWDYVVVIGDPYTMEYTPGLYAQGVAAIGKEVAKGTGETVLLMPWPATGSNSSVAHYKEVVYRAGRTGGYKVAPAALAWQADGFPTDATRRAYICAAAIYSTIWEQSAKNSSHKYTNSLNNTAHNAFADLIHTTVTTNNAATQYTGTFNFQNPFLMLGDKRRDVHHSEKGSSTEADFVGASQSAMNRCRVSYNSASYRDKYSSETPQDDGLGWPTANPMPIAWNQGRKFSEVAKEYVVNTDYWQLGMGYSYQSNTWADPVESANDTTIGQLYGNDLYLAHYMITQDNSARCIPRRLLWAQIHQEYPTLNPLRDGSGPHLNSDCVTAVGAYMYTLYSGRCPMDPQPATMTSSWYAQKVGYETAWRLGTCSTRAPGFKVMPSSATANTVTPSTTQTMTVQFIFAPQSDVTVSISSSDTSAGIVGPQTLVFTPSNYNVAQTVIVRGVEGATASAPFNVVYATTSDDPAYDGLSDSWAYTTTRAETTASHVDEGTTSYTTPKNFAVTTNLNAAGATSGNTTFAGPNHGALSWNGSDVVYTPNANYVGLDGFAYASLNGGTLTTGYISVDVIDGFPAGSVRVEASDSTATEEGRTTGTYAFIREGATTSSLVVNFSISGSATNGVDYNLSASSPVTIPAGQSSVAITLTPIDDNVFGELSETAVLTVTAGTGYVAISNPATVSITDNDNTAPTVDAGAPQQVSLVSGNTSPGLWYGTVSGSMNVTTPNPETLIVTDLTTYVASIGGNATEIFTGQIYDADGSISFTEDIDDSARIWIDGNLVITNDTWNARTSTSNLSLSPGWHNIEIRIGNGGGGNGTVSSPGIGYDPNGGTNWLNLVDPGDQSLLRVGGVDSAVVDLNGTVTDPEGAPATTWSLVSSVPSGLSVTFGDVSQVDTTATFTAEGEYTLRLTADDGYGTVSDEVVITVGPATSTYSVTYDANTADSGNVPLDATAYNADDEVTVLGNTGSLVKSGNSFAGWNTDPNGGGATYAGGSTFTINDNVTLYAQWSADPTYTLTVTNGTGDGDYAAGASASITADAPQANYRFVNWTTSDGGSFADANAASTTYTMPASAAQVTANYALNNLPVVDAGANKVVPLGADTTWTPSALGITAWYDASDTTTITQTSGAVSQWSDKSVNGNHMLSSGAAQPTTGTRTINGLNTIDFDGGSDAMQEASNAFGATLSEATVFAVCVIDATPASESYLELDPSFKIGPRYGDRFSTSVNGSINWDNWIEWYYPTLGDDVAAGSTMMLTPRYSVSENTYKNYVNGNIDTFKSGGTVKTANGTVTTTAGMKLLNLDGAWCEIVVFDEALDDAIRQKVEGYLAHKWGTAAKLPAGHPYKDAAPGAPGVAVSLADASVSDSDFDPLTTTWTVASKDPIDAADPTFDDTSLVNATATFTEVGTYVLCLTANDGYGDPVIDEVTITISAPLPSAYTSWASAKGLTDNAPASNPDGDWMSNLMEFAFGTDPTVADGRTLATDGLANGSPTLMEAAGGAMDFYYVRRIGGGLIYTVQFSSDLETFTDYTGGGTVVADETVGDPDYELIKVPFPEGDHFGRVEVGFGP